MNFKNLTNEKLSDELRQSVTKEREATVRVLWLLRECERRMLYAERGYTSLFAYCVLNSLILNLLPKDESFRCVY